MSDLTGRLLVKAFNSPTVWKVGTAAYNAYKKRKLIGGALATAGYMARGFKRRKVVKRPRKRFRRGRRGGSRSSVIGQYQQRSGGARGGRRRGGRGGRGLKMVKSAMFKLLPTQSMVITNMPGGAYADQGFFGLPRTAAGEKQFWGVVSMYGCQGIPSTLDFEANPDADLWSLYKQSVSSQVPIISNIPFNQKVINSMEYYIKNASLEVDFTWNPQGYEPPSGDNATDVGPADVTFYVVQPRKSQRANEKDLASSSFAQKFKNYFTEDYQYHVDTGTDAFNEINPITTQGCSPFDSRTFCKEWKVVSSKTIQVEDGNSCKYSWSRKGTKKITGADLDEYDFIKGAFTVILVRVVPIKWTISNLSTKYMCRMKYKKNYTYKVVSPSVSSAVVGVHQTTSTVDQT